MSINQNIRFLTCGSANTSSQVFYNNKYVDYKPSETTYFSFEEPMYFTYGGTLNYYSQDPYAIFTNLVRPPIRFVFSANTSSLSGDSYFVHEIYRLDYDTYKLYSDNQIDSSPNIVNTQNLDNANESSAQASLFSAPNITKVQNRQSVNTTKLKFGNNLIVTPEKFFGEPLTPKDFNTIQSHFKIPLVTITASTSAVTGIIYDLFLDQYTKQPGKYKTELFLDKSQYVINTKIVFNVPLNKGYTDFFKNVDNRIFASSWSDILTIQSTNSFEHSVISGPFAGISLTGSYFSYFVVPDKPKLEYPVMSGSLTTFTPEFRWSNGDNADSFMVQINYNMSDTGFTGTVYNYPVEKSAKNAQMSRSVIKDATSEFSTDKTIYTFQLPMKSNSNFIYRVGNSKELIDVFNVRRNVITFTDYFSATTQVEPIRIYVQAESDSGYVSEISGLSVPPSLDYESAVGEYILFGVISGSTVTGATIQLVFPNSSFITTMTDTTGAYSFSGLETGIYTMTTNYRGYLQDVRSINITGDTTLGFKLKLLWGDKYDTFGKMANENFFI